jgi:hypothetical protein
MSSGRSRQPSQLCKPWLRPAQVRILGELPRHKTAPDLPASGHGVIQICPDAWRSIVLPSSVSSACRLPGLSHRSGPAVISAAVSLTATGIAPLARTAVTDAIRVRSRRRAPAARSAAIRSRAGCLACGPCRRPGELPTGWSLRRVCQRLSCRRLSSAGSGRDTYPLLSRIGLVGCSRCRRRE